MPGLGIIAGAGDLPRLLAEDAAAGDSSYLVIGFAGVMPEWASLHPSVEARFEAPEALFAALRTAGCDAVVFAGGLDRPALDPGAFDPTMAAAAPRLIAAMAAGDDAVMAEVAALFDAAGFAIRAPHECLSGLLSGAGVLTRAQPSEDDRADADRAAEIVATLGALDIGQGAVVAQGLCLATETLPGTDAMLAFVAAADRARLPDQDGARGVLFKGPKPGQDRRMDLPSVGVKTIDGVVAAGLAGLVVEAGGVLLIGRDRMVAAADDAGIFLWSRPA